MTTKLGAEPALIARFQGSTGDRQIVAVVERSVLAGGNSAIAARLAAAGDLVGLEPGTKLIKEGAADTELYVILAGSVAINVKGSRVNIRGVGDHVGEIAAADPSQPRSADVVVVDRGVALRIPEAELTAVAEDHPDIWRRLFVEANARIVQRNALVRPVNAQPIVFMVSSSEALEVGREIQLALNNDDMIVVLWPDGVFRASEYPLESLAKAVANADFTIAVVHGDDVVRSRGKQAIAPRDNVTFELGLSMGQLGRDRTILVEPRDDPVKLASDLRGLTTVSYRTGPPDKIAALIAPTAHEIRKHIAAVGLRD